MRLLIPVLLLTGALSCKKEELPKEYTLQCVTSIYTLTLEKYDDNAVDTILLRAFTKDGGFSHPLSEQQYYSEDMESTSMSGAIQNVYRDFAITSDLDYEVILPATSDTIRISNINIEQRQIQVPTPEDGRTRPIKCHNHLTASATLNGLPVVAAERANSANGPLYLDISPQ